MSVWFWVILIAIALIGWLFAYMVAQKPVTNVQQLIAQKRFHEAVLEAERANDPLHRAGRRSSTRT